MNWRRPLPPGSAGAVRRLDYAARRPPNRSFMGVMIAPWEKWQVRRASPRAFPLRVNSRDSCLKYPPDIQSKPLKTRLTYLFFLSYDFFFKTLKPTPTSSSDLG
jgi:hypothetical protein